MGTFTYTVPVANVDPNSTADPEIATALQTLLTWGNGGIDLSNLSASLQSQINSGTVGPRGASNIAASESRTNTAYGTLTTPDQVTGMVLPTNGLIVVGYQATWQESVSGAARAAIFIGANQLKATASGAADINIQEANTGGDLAATNNSLTSSPIGLISGKAQFHSGDVTTGQALGVFGATTQALVGATAVTGLSGGLCKIFAAAGTYAISVQFKSSSGSVTASNRKLWVQTFAFS